MGKNRIWLSIMTAAIIVTNVTSTGAEIRRGAYSFTPSIGGYTFEGKQDLDDGTLFGLRLGYNVDERWAVESALDFIDSEFKSVDVGVDGYIFRVEGLYHFLPQQSFSPFLAAGLGGIDLQFENAGNNSGLLFNYGLGFKFSLTDTISFRGDIRHVIAYSNALSNFAYTVGLTFTFGGEKRKGPPAAFKDIDRDGVTDRDDMCPATPAGAPVDRRGCPLDSDADGVDDYHDRCPDTPAGISVNADGCEGDSDNDGVFDRLDRCPDTPTGAHVDTRGCSASQRKKVSMNFNVEFDYNSANVKEFYYPLLKKAADFMNKYPYTTAVIEGHTDSRGSEEYNLRISQARADSIKDFLTVELGIEPSRIEAIGYGESRPIADNGTKAGRERNRRVLVIIKSDTQ